MFETHKKMPNAPEEVFTSKNSKTFVAHVISIAINKCIGVRNLHKPSPSPNCAWHDTKSKNPPETKQSQKIHTMPVAREMYALSARKFSPNQLCKARRSAEQEKAISGHYDREKKVRVIGKNDD